MQVLDEIERFALILIGLGLVLVVWGVWVERPGSLPGVVGRNYHDWAPGLIIDGVLLWVVNSIFRRHERNRTLSQMGSLSREFALDAIRRAREEAWLEDGSLANRDLSRAALGGAHLAHSVLSGADLSFADLEDADLTYADLQGADLSGAHLARADLRWADLTGATVAWADLRGALLEGASLDGVDARFAAVDDRQAGEPELGGAIAGGFLDETQVREVQRTFDLLTAHGTAPVERFYDRLFEMAPETRPLFRTEPRRQAAKFLQSLRVIVSALHEPRKHVEVLRKLGSRHGTYGARPDHYPLVAEAFLATFAETLGPEFTPEARRAWERAFHLMTVLMTDDDGVRADPAPASPGRF